MKICRTFSVSLTAALIASGLLLTPLAASAPPPNMALQAAQMLGTERWVQPVRIENTNSSSRYPETVYGTVFEFNNTLWFYTATGSQPLNRSKDKAEEYKENLLPLLRTMERGFRSFVKLPVTTASDSSEFPSLKNGCVIESIFMLDELKVQGEPILKAKVLLYTSKNPNRSSSRRATGHAVLVYQTPTGMFYIDPPKINETGRLRQVLEWDAVEIAAEIESHYGKISIERAFFEPLDLPVTHLARSD